MRIVLWDTRRRGVGKDFAGGFGVGRYTAARGLPGLVMRNFIGREHRPVALLYAHLAAIFRRRSHQVEFCEDRIPAGAEVYVFNPALMTLDLERRAMAEVLTQQPRPRVLVIGALATHLSEAFAGRGATIVRGEAEQLHWQLDEVLASDEETIDVGQVEDLDRLPLPDWSPFRPGRFRLRHDFWQFPTALVQASRGCALACDYCPYIAGGRALRQREPEAVADEIRWLAARHNFRSFKFRDPLFGADPRRAWELVERLGRLPKRVQFSVESRLQFLPDDLLAALARVGLTSVTFGAETPDAGLLREHSRAPLTAEREREFVERCRRLGLRTVAGFMLGFAGDTEASIRAVQRYARWLNPTLANFNVVTPYPGTAFYRQMQPRIRSFDFSRFDGYTSVIAGEHLAAEDIHRLLEKTFVRHYFRGSYLKANWRLLWPRAANLADQLASGLRRDHRLARNGEEPAASHGGPWRRFDSADNQSDGLHAAGAVASDPNPPLTVIG
ncbi:MAG TPA: radical SAM protein [Pirellulales bacterium]|nr:radical SAM protein [Pirellulales bacterium]